MSKLLGALLLVSACQPARVPAPQHPVAIVKASTGPGRADVDPQAMRPAPLAELITTGHERCGEPASPIDVRPLRPVAQYLAENATHCTPVAIPKL